MVLSFLVGFSAVFATSEGIKASQSKARREEHRSRKNNLVVHCPRSSRYSPLLEGRRVVLSGNKLYIDTGLDPAAPFGHPFAGYYLPYPDRAFSGLVSTITDVAPVMNWVFVARDTYEVKFGVRAAAEENFTGPFDCTRQDRRLTFAGWEGFVAVRERDGGFWELYFDRDDDCLRGKKLPAGAVTVEVELLRREIRTPQPPAPAPAPPPSPPSSEPSRDEEAADDKPREAADDKPREAAADAPRAEDLLPVVDVD